MKRIVLALLLGLFASAAYATTPAPVASQIGTCSNGGLSTTCTTSALPSPTVVGRYLIYRSFACSDVTCAAPSSITQTAVTAQGDTFTGCGQFGAGSSNAHYEVWYAKVTVAGTAVTTITYSGNAYYASATIFEVSGLAAASPCNTTGSIQGTSTTASVTADSPITECNVFLFATTFSADTGAVQGSGWTAIGTPSGGNVLEYKVQATVTTPTAIFATTNSAFTSIIAAFKSDAGTCGAGSQKALMTLGVGD